MGEYLDMLPEGIGDHIKSIARTSGLPPGDESLELLAQGWLGKKDAFEEQTTTLKMEEKEEFALDSPRGALIMTNSGSLITVGPMIDEHRRVEYVSIGLRQDVPDTAVNEHSTLEDDIRVGEPARFTNGPLQQSSAVYKIAVHTEQMEPEREIEKLSEATQIITQEFVDVNRTMVVEKET